MSILGKMSKILFKLSSFLIKGKIKLTKNIKKVLIIIIIKDLLLTNVDFRSTGIGRIIAIKVSFELVRIIDINIREIYSKDVILLYISRGCNFKKNIIENGQIKLSHEAA